MYIPINFKFSKKSWKKRKNPVTVIFILYHALFAPDWTKPMKLLTDYFGYKLKIPERQKLWLRQIFIFSNLSCSPWSQEFCKGRLAPLSVYLEGGFLASGFWRKSGFIFLATIGSTRSERKVIGRISAPTAQTNQTKVPPPNQRPFLINNNLT